MDDALLDDSVVDSTSYSPTSAADSPARMDMEEYDSTMTDMHMSIGVDKASAQLSVGTFPRNLMHLSSESMAEATSSVKPTTLVDQLVSEDYML